MTNVIHQARPRAAGTVQTSAQTSNPIDQQAAIENSLSLALHYVRGDQKDGLRLATAKAHRALSLLKQACAVATARKEG